MSKKQLFTSNEKEIALNSWYSCMIAMGSVPYSEDLYSETRTRFLKKYGIDDISKITTTCDDEYHDLKMRYYNIINKSII